MRRRRHSNAIWIERSSFLVFSSCLNTRFSNSISLAKFAGVVVLDDNVVVVVVVGVVVVDDDSSVDNMLSAAGKYLIVFCFILIELYNYCTV